MVTTWGMRTLVLFALAAAAAAITAGTGQARPDPGERLSRSSTATGKAAAELRRPTGRAEHTTVGGPARTRAGNGAGPALAGDPGTVVAFTVGDGGFDWVAAGLGAIAATAAIAFAAGVVSTRRYVGRVRGAA